MCYWYLNGYLSDVDIFGALADPVRRSLLADLTGGPQRVVDLAEDRPISRPAVSKHLRLLLDAGAVTVAERGRERYYALDRSALGTGRLVRRRADRATPRRQRPRRTRHRGAPYHPRTAQRRRTRGADRMTQLGTITQVDGRHVLVQTREFQAPIEDVWAAVTEPERLARWIGTWSGDPESGSVLFRMLFEGEDHEAEIMTIRVCEPPRRLHLTSQVGDDTWLLELDLSHEDGVTTLTFAQPGVTAEQVGGVGPGWDYYLDRLVDAETGADPSLRDFERTTTRRPRSTTSASSVHALGRTDELGMSRRRKDRSDGTATTSQITEK